jgi:hypothetical protein
MPKILYHKRVQSVASRMSIRAVAKTCSSKAVTLPDSPPMPLGGGGGMGWPQGPPLFVLHRIKSVLVAAVLDRVVTIGRLFLIKRLYALHRS